MLESNTALSVYYPMILIYCIYNSILNKSTPNRVLLNLVVLVLTQVHLGLDPSDVKIQWF